MEYSLVSTTRVYRSVYGMEKQYKDYVYEYVVVGASENPATVVHELYSRNHTHVCIVPGTAEDGTRVWVVMAGVVVTGEQDYLGDLYKYVDDGTGEPTNIESRVDGVDPMLVVLSW